MPTPDLPPTSRLFLMWSGIDIQANSVLRFAKELQKDRAAATEWHNQKLELLSDAANKARTPEAIAAFEDAISEGNCLTEDGSVIAGILLRGVDGAGQQFEPVLPDLEARVVAAEHLLHDEVIPLVQDANDAPALKFLRSFGKHLAALRQQSLSIRAAVFITRAIIELDAFENAHRRVASGFGSLDVLCRDKNIAKKYWARSSGKRKPPPPKAHEEQDGQIWMSAAWYRKATGGGIDNDTLRMRWSKGNGSSKLIGEKRGRELYFEFWSVVAEYGNYKTTLRAALAAHPMEVLGKRIRAKPSESKRKRAKKLP